ncbi:MAG: peroxidase family protein [Pseudomonadota bacterium]
MVLLTGDAGSASGDLLDPLAAFGPAIPAFQACGYTDAAAYPKRPRLGRFDYLVPEAAETVGPDGRTAALDVLAHAMIGGDDARGESAIPAVFTYFGLFIDHDIAAKTAMGPIALEADEADIEPLERVQAVGAVGNLRRGTLNLDSVYGGGPEQGPLARKLAAALRWPADRAKLRAGTLVPSGETPVPVPSDERDVARDLLRLDEAIGTGPGDLNEAELRALCPDLRRLFFDGASLRRQRAIIGDMRNDQNLALAQFHLAILRLHNVIVDEAEHHNVADDEDTRFRWARERTTWHYQWLVANAYLPAIYDAHILDEVATDGPRLYDAFAARLDGGEDGLLPLPLEFSAAAFRFGQCMMRDRYDWSRAFPQANGGAPFDLLSQFTGYGQPPMPCREGGIFPRLPDNLPVEWDRLVHPVTSRWPARSARRIDTRLAPARPLGPVDVTAPHRRMRDIASRTLRRGLRFNLPSAQALIRAIGKHHQIHVPVLSPDQLRSGHTRAAVEAGGFHEDTPLWFYVLKEAEMLGADGRLGPLGSRLVADTLTGLIRHDRSSYWFATDIPGGWHPKDSVRPDCVIIDSVPALMRAARLR